LTSKNLKDKVAISRDSPKSSTLIREALRDYQGASFEDDGIVQSPSFERVLKYPEREGKNEQL